MLIDRTSNIRPNGWYKIIYVTHRDIIVYFISIGISKAYRYKLKFTATFQVREIKAYVLNRKVSSKLFLPREKNVTKPRANLAYYYKSVKNSYF